jgi:hypothetical protein
VYEEFLDVAALLPTKHLERLSSPANWWELTPIKLYRYLEANFPHPSNCRSVIRFHYYLLDLYPRQLVELTPIKLYRYLEANFPDPSL